MAEKFKAALKEVAGRHWPVGTVIKILAAVTTWFPSTPDPLLIGAAMYQDPMDAERKTPSAVRRTAAELRKTMPSGNLKIETAVVDTTRSKDVAVGPSTHLRVSQSTAFSGAVQMNPTMRVLKPRSPRLVVANDS